MNDARFLLSQREQSSVEVSGCLIHRKQASRIRLLLRQQRFLGGLLLRTWPVPRIIINPFLITPRNN